tara:strand:- start:23 stop:328 length:306 start_codon:yes stop_codon:yes gene_type:complete
MPTYSFKNTETGEEFEELFSMSDREKFLEQNPHIKQLPSLFAMSYTGTGDRIKNDSGWKDNLSRIAEAHPGSPLAYRHGKKSTKDINTRQVLKKHKILKDV